MGRGSDRRRPALKPLTSAFARGRPRSPEGGRRVRRADRLFEIIQSLRRRGLVRARELSAALEVSERTIYRDIQDLVASGVPIEGEAGVGYVLKAGFDLPP